MKVKIPFMERFREPMLNGTKTQTARSKRYGEKGDHFKVFGAEFIIDCVLRMELEEIMKHWKQEGFESLEDFKITWCKIHPRRKLTYLNEPFWVHVFHKFQFATTEREKNNEN